LKSETAVLHECIALVPAALAQNLTACLEAEDLVNRCLHLVGNYKLLNGAGVVEARFDKVVEKPDQELLSILLFPEAVAGHDPFHEWLYNFSPWAFGLVG